MAVLLSLCLTPALFRYSCHFSLPLFGFCIRQVWSNMEMEVAGVVVVAGLAHLPCLFRSQKSHLTSACITHSMKSGN